jgi:NADPH-dependent 2,4-dienoyl-CoA reductase/sulfur reductase-like enzyme
MIHTDLLIIGAGPAGMSAAITARKYGLDVTVVDDQPAPGGQIWRSVEATRNRDEILGPSYVEGRAVAEAFRASGAHFLTGAQLWRIEPSLRAFISRDRKAEAIAAKAIVLATGAQERPVPFPGWTLPGVLTVGAAQILLKNAGQIPADPVWIAGSGPLPLLYAVQLLRAGGQIAGYLDTTPSGQWQNALHYAPAALRGFGDIMKGIGWKLSLRRRVPVISDVADLEALGDERVHTIRYRTRKGKQTSVAAETLLIHEGVVPSIHPAMSMNCKIRWDDAQDCFAPVLDEWGETSHENVFISGDGAGIAGAKAAKLRGKLSALRVATKLGHLGERAAELAAGPLRRKLARELAIRPFLDALFRPRPQVFAPVDEAVACRCEEVTAGEIRRLAMIGQPGPNQLKAACRAGMGPCQGRLCGYTVTRILAEAQQRSPEDVGFYNIRPPLKPVTIGELASLNEEATI